MFLYFICNAIELLSWALKCVLGKERLYEEN